MEQARTFHAGVVLILQHLHLALAAALRSAAASSLLVVHLLLHLLQHQQDEIHRQRDTFSCCCASAAVAGERISLAASRHGSRGYRSPSPPRHGKPVGRQ